MSYRAKRATEAANEPLSALQCSHCTAVTDWQTLSNYGARCHRCFGRYASFGFPASRGDEPPLTLAEKRGLLQHLASVMAAKPQGKDWAFALQRREEKGETLSPAQRDAWRRALRQHLTGGA